MKLFANVPFFFFAILFVSLGLSLKAQAYPQFIRLGYHACIGCHYNPAGGGLLTPYGKGIAATQNLFAKELTEEEEEKLSAQKYFQGFQGRLLDYKTKEKNRIFPMQVEYMGRYEINPKIKLNAVLSVAPKPVSTSPENAPKTHERTYFRVAELIYNFDKNNLLLTGISPLPIGLGLIDHTVYVRSQNRLQITDIPLNLRYFSNHEDYSYNAFIFAPHYLEKENNRETGFGGQYWYRFNKNLSLGVQSLNGKSPSIRRHLGGLLFKTGIKEFSFLSEINYTHRIVLADHNQFGQITHYQQVAYHPNDWLMLSYIFQGLSKDRDFQSSENQHGILFQAKLARWFTLIAESKMRINDGNKTKSYLLQGFVQWW